MKRLMLGALMACSVSTLLVHAQRRVKFDANNEYTLTVDKQTSDQINGWWRPFQLQNSLEGYCWNLNTLPLADRPQLGDKAKILKVGGAGQLTQVIEIAPGRKTAWHGYGWEGEALFYVLSGRGQTEYRGMIGGLPSNKYTWKKNSLFAIPVDHEIQHTSLDPAQPVRLLAVTGYAIFVILKGSGYDIWSEARDLKEYEAAVKAKTAHRADYGTGTLCGVPGGPHWHQHFSTGTEPLRYLAIVPRGEYEEKTPSNRP